MQIDYPAKKLRYEHTPEDRAWLWRRFGWYLFQLILFLIIAFRIGPNLILFHSLFSPDPADFVHYTNQYVPMIAAIKAYNRDFGKLPYGSWGLPLAYKPKGLALEEGEILNTTSITFVVNGHNVLEYEFSPAIEGWKIHSPRYDGPIPAPIVAAAPKPATIPSSGPSTSTPDGG